MLTLSSAKPFDWVVEQSAATAHFALEKGEARWLVLRYDDDDIHPVDRYESDRKLEITAAFWARWAAGVRYSGPFRGMVKRSALALKLLTHAETGAIIAAPTTSLPETIGGVRNWDYRFVWLRDAAFTLAALDAVGHRREADAFMRFLKRVCRHEGGGHLQIMYGIDGRRDLVERQLDHLSGYRGSRPVRVGNGAVGQLQLDVYGEVLETADIWRRNHEMTEGTWRVLRGAGGLGQPELAPARLQHLGSPGRGAPLRVQQGDELGGAGSRGPDGRGARPRVGHRRGGGPQRDALHAEIMERGWSERHQSFIQAYDDDALDAAALAIPMVRFLPWNHPRVQATVRAIARELTSTDGELVYRYRHPGRAGGRGRGLLDLYLLAGAVPGDDRRARGGRAGLPPDAAPRQPRWALLRGDRPGDRPVSGQLSPGLHPHRPDQLRLGPGAGKRQEVGV